MLRVRRFLTGHDIFISYSRRDGTKYATAVANQLATAKYSCLFDQWLSSPGKEIPLKLQLAIRMSSLCIVIGSKERPNRST